MSEIPAPGDPATVNRTGVLLVNLGTPDAPTTSAVRRYLSEFLSDPRVVEIPRWLWNPILLVVLAFRSSRSARLYKNVWKDSGSPLLSNTMLLAGALQQKLGEGHRVVAGMRYGKPAISDALQTFQTEGIKDIFVIPLYPQYSGSTTGSVFDAISNTLTKKRYVPKICFLNEYYRDENYVNALAASIEKYWTRFGRSEKLLFSFHGIPRRYVESGDPYANHCEETAMLVAARLGLASNRWQLVYQSRFGRAEWLQPYCATTLQELPSKGISSVDIFCPGFACDCLETLDEINRENRELFLNAGGETYHYIPCLNDSDSHVKVFADIVSGSSINL
jgi:ferrochelatase